MKPLKLYDTNMNLVAILENATKKGYQKRLNELWTCTFTLPADDPKNVECLPYRIVEFFDGNERIDLFRILPFKYEKDDTVKTITYECEHVLATLIDDILFQYHERVNLSTTSVLEYILSFQSTVKWQLGTVDFSYLFSYKWENEKLLGSLFSVPKPFVDEYQWTWDTTTFPWTLNLIASDSEVKTYIRYGRNMKGISKQTDPTNLCTRMYCLGYGEGVNQLTINSVNSGVPYIDADTLGTYGVISRIFTDTKEEYPATLKAKAQAVLEKLKVPRLSYAVTAAHLYQITNKSIDDFYLGAYCKAIDSEDNITFTARVVTYGKADVDEAPGDVDLEIANSPEDIAASISELANRQRISEVYSQGATNIMTQDFADNADSTYPVIIRFYIPDETVRINKMLLNYQTSNFRAYSKAIKGGGSITKSTAAGGATVESSDPGVWTLSPPQFLLNDFMNSSGSHDHGGTNVEGFEGLPSHWHTIPDDGSHAHSMYSVAHSHDVELPNHTHDIELPDHTHDIDYGIYLNPEMPTSLTVEVDGTEVPGLGLNEDDVDLIPYLSKDSNGKVNRGTWHELRITPNDLARIEANIVTQLFVQSRGGGDY